MKKSTMMVLTLALVAGFAIVGNAQAANYEQVAIKAAQDAGCIENGEKNIETSVELTSGCFVEGYIHTVYVYLNPAGNCHDTPNKPCPKPAVQLKATVQFGCNDEVASVTCY